MASEDSGMVEPVFPIEKKKRCENMSDDQVFKLIDIWEEHLPELRRLKRNSSVYVKMVAALKDLHGIIRKPTDIKTKIQNLSKEYRRERIRMMMGNDGTCASTWKFYKAVHGVIGSLPVGGDRTCSSARERLSAPDQFLVQDVDVKYAPESHFDVSEPESALSLDIDTEFVYSPVVTVDVADDTSSTSTAAGPRRKKKKQPHDDAAAASSTMNKILEAMLREQMKANEQSEKAMTAAESLDVRAVHLLEEHNLLQRQSLEIQRTILTLLSDLKK